MTPREISRGTIRVVVLTYFLALAGMAGLSQACAGRGPACPTPRNGATAAPGNASSKTCETRP